nr:HXXEE domain-containing protein [uncultured Anaerostipes sp.]
MKKDWLKIWCDQVWLYALYSIGVIMSCILIVEWGDLSIPKKMMCFLTILVPIHVFEENTFPGGFFYMNNIGQKSKNPLVYPQNMLTNMYTNFGAEIIFILLFIFADKIPITAAVVAAIFGYAECIHHTRDGINMYLKYKKKGKKTIYGPGSLSSFVGLIQLSTYALIWLIDQKITMWAVGAGLGIVFFIIVGMILIPFQISKKVKSQRFAFQNCGYFEKYERTACVTSEKNPY